MQRFGHRLSLRPSRRPLVSLPSRVRWISRISLASLITLVSFEAGAIPDPGADALTIGAGFGAVVDADAEAMRFDPEPGSVLDLDAPLWQPGVLDPAAGLPGRWQRELDRRRALLDAHPGNDHGAALALLGLLPTLSGEIDRAQLLAFVEAIEADRRRHPLVRSLAADVHGALLEDAGDLDGARALYKREGRLLDWQIVGPFDNANRTGHDQVYGPEQEAWDPIQSFAGKLADEPLAWRAHAARDALGGGYVSFDEFLRPNEYVTAYATTWVRVDEKTKAVIHVGTGGAHKIWVGGQLVGEGEAYHSPHPLQDAYALTLEPGWSRVLIKVGCEQGAWGFHARLSAADGSAIAGLEVQSAPPTETEDATLAPPVEATDEAPTAGLSLRKLFEDAADQDSRRKVAPADELALTEFYGWVGPFGREDFTARDQAREADAAVGSARSALQLALAEDDSARARKALLIGVERAEAAGDAARSEHAQLLIELAYNNAALGLERRATELLAKARRVSPDDALIELAHLDALANDGFDLAAMAWLEDLRGRYPNSATILGELANRTIGLGRVREGLGLLEQHSQAHRGDVAVIEQRIDAHLRLGEIDAALTLGRDLAAASPGRPSSWLRLAGLEEAAAHYDLAVAAMATAVDLAPQDAGLHAALGFLQSRAGDGGASVLAFQRSLELNPQQPELRDLLTTLGASDDDVFTRYAVDLEEVVAAVADAPTPKAWQGKDAAVLHRMVATRVDPSGLGERLDHRIIKILDERGIESQSRHDFGYEPDESYVEVRRARVYRSDGRIEDIGVTRHYSIGSAGYRMYYDQRGVAVQFPSLRVGDVVEVAFVRRDVASRNKFDDYYGDLVALEDTAPIRHLEYVLETPADMKLYFNHKVDSQAVEGEGGAKKTVHRLVRDDIAALRTEGDMPGWTEVADYLHVSTYADWDAVGRWYWGLVEGQLIVDDAIKAGVASALADLPKDASERDKVAALYRHVIEETRYVGLEFGIHGYKPYRTTDIYNRRFGDCKDKASLLKVMLGEIGVQSHLVLVRTRDLGTIADKPASLSAFNHAIVYVPKFDLFMDGTAEHSGAFELPAGDQGASVVVIEDGQGATFRTIPYATPDQNHSTYDLDVRLQASGDAEVEHAMSLHGTGAASWRANFEAAEKREELLTKQLSRAFPGLTVESAQFPTIDDVLAPVRVEAKLRIPGWAQIQQGQAGQTLRFRVLGHEVELLRSIAPQPKRDQPMVLGVPNREVRRIDITIPRGYTLVHTPEAAKVESSFGRFSLDIETHAHGATVTTSLEFSRPRVEPGEYPALRDFLREVDAALAQAFEAAPAR